MRCNSHRLGAAPRVVLEITENLSDHWAKSVCWPSRPFFQSTFYCLWCDLKLHNSHKMEHHERLFCSLLFSRAGTTLESPKCSEKKKKKNWKLELLLFFKLYDSVWLSAGEACVIREKAPQQLQKGTLLRDCFVKCCFQHQLITGVIHFVMIIIIFVIVIAAIIAVTTVVIVLIIVITVFNSHRQCN